MLWVQSKAMAGSKDPAGAVQLWQRLRLWFDLAQQVRTQTASRHLGGPCHRGPCAEWCASVTAVHVFLLNQASCCCYACAETAVLCWVWCGVVCCAVQATSLSELQQLGMAGLEQEVGSSSWWE